MNALMEDAEVLDWLRDRAATARYVSSVCTGSLVLGAAGLLRGKRATSHWGARDLLAAFGAIPIAGRVVRDGNVFTGGGVTAGIDFALTMAAELAGERRRAGDPIADRIFARHRRSTAGTPETAQPIWLPRRVPAVRQCARPATRSSTRRRTPTADPSASSVRRSSRRSAHAARRSLGRPHQLRRD